jgi:hypothetical protein
MSFVLGYNQYIVQVPSSCSSRDKCDGVFTFSVFYHAQFQSIMTGEITDFRQLEISAEHPNG